MAKQETIQHYLDQIGSVFPNLFIKQVKSNFEGMVNDVIIVNGTRVFHFPRNEWARGVQPIGSGW